MSKKSRLEKINKSILKEAQRYGLPRRRSRTGISEEFFDKPSRYVDKELPFASGILRDIAAIPVLIQSGNILFNAAERATVNAKINAVDRSDIESFVVNIKNNPTALTNHLQRCKGREAQDISTLINDLNKDPDRYFKGPFNPGTESGYKNISDLKKKYIKEVAICDKKLKKEASSINNKEEDTMKFSKKADKYSDTFYRDAVKGLNNDAYMKAFYKEMASEYDKKTDYKPTKRKDLMDFFYEEEHIMAQAHPNSTYVADAMGQGGLVENGVERLNTIKNIVNKKTTGNNF
jgi:hypothetical protein